MLATGAKAAEPGNGVYELNEIDAQPSSMADAAIDGSASFSKDIFGRGARATSAPARNCQIRQGVPKKQIVQVWEEFGFQEIDNTKL